jgi:hypothetical protein
MTATEMPVIRLDLNGSLFTTSNSHLGVLLGGIFPQ